MSTAETPGVRPMGRIEQAALQLRGHIASGEWPVGSRIPTEPELAELTGVGRNTVREAVQALVHAGMLERRQGSGTYVISDSELASAMNRQFAEASQRDVLEVRRALEVEAARLAARRRSDEDVAGLWALQHERADAIAVGDLAGMVDADTRMHRTIAECSGNPVLAQIYDTLLDAVIASIRFNFQHVAHAADDHLDLIKAIEARDALAAGREIGYYLDEVLASLPGPTA